MDCGVAQLVEQVAVNHRVGGSSPSATANCLDKLSEKYKIKNLYTYPIRCNSVLTSPPLNQYLKLVE